MIAVIEKMIKQRRDSITQYQAGGRKDLADAEQFEIDTLSAYLPKQADEVEVDAVISDAMAATGAKGLADMGKVMGVVQPQVKGRADGAAVAAEVRRQLAAS